MRKKKNEKSLDKMKPKFFFEKFGGKNLRDSVLLIHVLG